MKKKALVITALAGFVRGFLSSDIMTLQSMGYEVHCAANANVIGTENIDEYFAERNVFFHQIDFSSTKPFSKQTLNSLFQFKSLIKNENFDLVHCHTPIAAAIARISCREYRKKGMQVIYTSHGFYFHQGSSKKNWIIYHTIEKFLSRFSDAIITINKEDYSNAEKMHCKKVFYINGVGVDTQKYRNIKIDRIKYREKLGINSDAFIILSIGELSERKNHQVIIKAISELNDSNIVFVICGRAMQGSGTYDALCQLSEQLNVNVKFLGFREDIPQLCNCADIGAIPSLREGLGLAGIELLASGAPLIGSNVHGIKDYLIDGVTGYGYEPFDYKGFARGILALMNKEKRMRQECIKISKNFDINVSIEQMKRIYEELLSDSDKNEYYDKRTDLKGEGYEDGDFRQRDCTNL